MILCLAAALSALQAQNTVTVSEVTMQQGETAILSVELNNETAFAAFQMDLKLPDGFSVATTINEDDEEVLDIALGADRKKSTHLLTYNVLSNGTIRIASYSNANAAYKGTSGEIVRFRIAAAESVALGTYTAQLDNVIFTTADAVDHRIEVADISIAYSASQGVTPDTEHNVVVRGSRYGRCLWNGGLVEPTDTFTMTEIVEDGEDIMLFFIPFKGYAATSMKRNGEVVAILDNVYEETATEDVVFTDVNYEEVVDTFVVTETVVDTLVVTETIVDTLVVTETVVDTLVVTETVVDTLVVTETIVDTLVVTETIVDTLVVEKTDTVFITEIEELPTPVITCDNGVVTITCEQEDAIILYAINGDPIEGSVYAVPFEVSEDAVVSAVAVRSSEKAELSVTGTGVTRSQMRVVSRRYYTENGTRVTSPEAGVTIVVAEYEDGTTQVYKLVKR